MFRAAGNIDGIAGPQGNLLLPDGHDGLPPDQVPVFRPAPVALQAQAFSRFHGDPLDLVIRFISQDRIAPPRTLIRFHENPLPTSRLRNPGPSPRRFHENITY